MTAEYHSALLLGQPVDCNLLVQHRRQRSGRLHRKAAAAGAGFFHFTRPQIQAGVKDQPRENDCMGYPPGEKDEKILTQSRGKTQRDRRTQRTTKEHEEEISISLP